MPANLRKIETDELLMYGLCPICREEDQINGNDTVTMEFVAEDEAQAAHDDEYDIHPCTHIITFGRQRFVLKASAIYTA